MKKSDFSYDIEKYTKLFFNNLSEKDKRLYAGFEAIKLGYYGVQDVSILLGIDKQTVRKGKKELVSESLLPSERIRKMGMEVKKVEIIANIGIIFLSIILNFTAGNPMKTNSLWTNLTCKKISFLFKDFSFIVGRRYKTTF